MSSIDSYLFDGPHSNSNSHYPNQQPHYSQEYKKDILKSQIQALNSKVSAFGIPPIGNLLSPNIDEVQKTLETIRRFLSYRQKEIENKSESMNKIRKLQNQKETLQLSNEKLLKDKSNLQCEKEQFKQKLKTMEKLFKQQNDKMTAQRKQLQKDLLAIQNRQGQFNNDYRKKDLKIQEYEQKHKKFIQERQPPRNSFELISAIEQNGPSVYYLNADHEYSQMIQKNYQDIYEKLTNENNYLRECLGSIYRELNDILEMRKEMLTRRKQLDNQNFDINGLNLSTFKMELFNMPLDNSKEAIEMLDDNLKRFRDQMDRLDIIGNDQRGDNDTDKIKTLKNVKGLIKNYKYIVQSQDQMLGKVMMKAKDLRMTDSKGFQSKFTKSLEEDQIRNARRFIDDQKSYLESKEKELQMTRKAMSTTIKRVEEEKNQMNRRRREIEEEGNKLKRQIQLLPCIIDS